MSESQDKIRELLCHLNNAIVGCKQQKSELTAQRDELLGALELALEYWQHRQQRYKNRHPAWVVAARAVIKRCQPEG